LILQKPQGVGIDNRRIAGAVCGTQDKMLDENGNVA
jgi:hypothetical protein